MSITIHKLLALLFTVAAIASPINGLESRKLDESSTVPPGTPNTEIKCGSCSPCSPCNPSPPPPTPTPTPPSPPPPSPPPPPTPKKPPTPSNYCPPPPSPPFIYITGPPGELYPVDPNSGAGRIAVGLPVMICFGLLGLLAF